MIMNNIFRINKSLSNSLPFFMHSSFSLSAFFFNDSMFAFSLGSVEFNSALLCPFAFSRGETLEMFVEILYIFTSKKIIGAIMLKTRCLNLRGTGDGP